MRKLLNKHRQSWHSFNRVLEVMDTMTLKETLSGIATVAVAMIVVPTILLILVSPSPVA